MVQDRPGWHRLSTPSATARIGRHTAIFITWDDWGGWYDHVAPSIYNSYEYGFRVPLIVVSPYAKRSYVSHVTHDFGSILKFIEEDFNLPSLGYADARADDLSDCFDFNQRPATFRKIAAPYDANYFSMTGHRRRQPTTIDPGFDRSRVRLRAIRSSRPARQGSQDW